MDAIDVLVTLVSPFSTESFCFPFSIVLRCDVQLVFGSSLLKVTSWNSLDFEVSFFCHFRVHFPVFWCRKARVFLLRQKRNFRFLSMAASPTEMSLLALMPTPRKPVSGVELETWVRLVRSDFDFKIFLWKKVTHTEFLSFVWCSQIFTSFLGIFFIFFQSGLAQMRRWWKLMFLSWGSVRSVTLQWLCQESDDMPEWEESDGHEELEDIHTQLEDVRPFRNSFHSW